MDSTATQEAQYRYVKDRADKGEWIIAPRGVEADNLLLSRASQENGYVVSNDNFEDLTPDFPWVSQQPQRWIKVQRLGNGNFTLAPANQGEQQALRKKELEQERARQHAAKKAIMSAPGKPKAPPSPSPAQSRQPGARRGPSPSPKLDVAELRDRILLPAFLAAKEIGQDFAGGSAMGDAIRRLQENFEASTYGYPKLRRLLESMPDTFRIEDGTTTTPGASGMRIYLTTTKTIKARASAAKSKTKRNDAAKKKPAAGKSSKKSTRSKASRQKVKL